MYKTKKQDIILDIPCGALSCVTQQALGPSWPLMKSQEINTGSTVEGPKPSPNLCDRL